MATWQGRLRASGWRDAYVFLKHEGAGAGPRLVGTLLALDASRAPRAVRRASPADESKTG